MVNVTHMKIMKRKGNNLISLQHNWEEIIFLKEERGFDEVNLFRVKRKEKNN